MKKSKRQKAVIDIINKMFEFACHPVTYDDIIGRNDNWFLDWEIDEQQEQEWIVWSVEYLRKELKLPKKIAQREMLFLAMNFGLKTKTND